MNEFIRHTVVENKLATRLAIGASVLSASIILNACTSGEEPQATPTPERALATPIFEEMCAIGGMENFTFSDEDCVIGPQSKPEK